MSGSAPSTAAPSKSLGWSTLTQTDVYTIRSDEYWDTLRSNGQMRFTLTLPLESGSGYEHVASLFVDAGTDLSFANSQTGRLQDTIQINSAGSWMGVVPAAGNRRIAGEWAGQWDIRNPTVITPAQLQAALRAQNTTKTFYLASQVGKGEGVTDPAVAIINLEGRQLRDL